jgi:Predicted membrane protein
MWDHMGYYGWGGMGFGMLLFWGLLIAGIVMLVRGSGGCGKPERADSALDILKQRYARGEIEKDEFEQKRRDLKS